MMDGDIPLSSRSREASDTTGIRRSRRPSTQVRPVETRSTFRRKSRTPYGMIVLHEGEEGPNSGLIADFVLVHGLTGNYLNTWTKEKDGQKDFCWPRDMLPELRPDIRIMSSSYDADVVHMCCGSPAAAGDIEDYADELLQNLNAERDSKDAYERPIIFLGHSLGGLVIERAMLIASRSEAEWSYKIFQCTKAIFTFGTPHYGSRFANIALPMARLLRPFHYFNIKLLEAAGAARKKQSRGSKLFIDTEWQEEFVDLLKRRKADNVPIYFFCGVEQLGTGGIPFLHRVVPGRSAVLNGSRDIIERCQFHTNHSDLVRFNDPNDKRFQLFIRKLDKRLQELPTPPPRRASLAPPYSVATSTPLGLTSPRVDLLPAMKKEFIGRKAILEDVYEKLKSWKRDNPAIVVLIANGGWGKSQIALEYARRHYETRTYEAVFWVDASSEQAAKLGFAKIWERMNPSASLLSGEEKFEKACKALQNMTQRWLLVLDNFDRSVLDSEDMAEGNTNPHDARRRSDSPSYVKGIQRSDSDGPEESYIRRFIPKNDFGHIIITSREKNTRRLGYGLEVELMSENEAIEMLKSRYVDSAGSSEGWDNLSANAIVKELGYLPLAIEQVSSYLACSQMPMEKFLDHYRQNKTQILQLVPEQSNFRKSYVQEGPAWLKKTLGVLTVWEMSLIAVKREEKQRIRDLAIEILQLSGFLDRTGISITFLTKMDKPESYGDGHHRWIDLKHPSFSIDLYRAVKLLDRWHLIESLTNGDEDDRGHGETFTVHPLVQEWVRLRMSQSDVYGFITKAIRLIEKNLAKDHDQLLATTSGELNSEIIRHIGTIEELTQGDQPELEGLDSVHLGDGSFSGTAITFGSFYHDMGYLNNAEKLFQLVKEKHQGRNEDQDPRFLEAEEGLALVRLWEEKGDEAYKLLSHARNCFAMLPKEYTRATLRATHNLGEVECFRKNFNEAIKLFDTCLAGFATEFGRTSKETHREREALGNAYRAKGDTEKAFQHISEAQKRLEEIDPTADSTVNATESLALVMKAKGELKRAEELYKKVISLYEQSIGRGAYTTLGAMTGLADTYRKGRRWKDAEELYKEIMTRHEESLGTQEAQYVRAKEAYENITSAHPDIGPPDDFSYPWPRAVAEYQTRPRSQSGQN